MIRKMGEDGPASLEYIQAKDLFPQKQLVKEEESLQVPFPVLQGESVEYLGRADDGIIAISNYRLHIKFKDSVINVPLRLIETAESRDMFQLHIVCKDSKVIRCHFSTFKQCQEWLKRLSRAIAHPLKLEDLFAFAYHAWCLGVYTDEEDQHAHLCQPGDHVKHRFEMEVSRMGFDMRNAWRISDINSNFKLCSSYPQKIIVPVWITDKELEKVASFRSGKRIPVVVYRHLRNGAVIARCSQPEVSWWGWRNADDEYLATSIAKACAFDSGSRTSGNSSGVKNKNEGDETCDADFDSSLTACSNAENSGSSQKLLILDARSYTAAVANRAKGGGCECEEYYPNCEVVFMGMANIHAIRNSFQALRAACSQMPDPSNWLSTLEGTKWLQHLSIMLKAATLVSNAVDREGRPVLVHCSDGWDRTPQIVALAKLLLDPFYRTIEGFQVLVETEWLDFGHKFGDRCGHQENLEDQHEQCPVFLQWLDCVHQLMKQFPCLFEFNEAFLVKLVQHTYSCLYGTFLCNNLCEREQANVYKRTCSVWSLLRTGNKNFQNFLYIPGNETQLLHPICHVRALHLWTAVYLPTSSPCTPAEESMEHYLPMSPQNQELCARSLDRFPKTRSVDNLLAACEGEGTAPLTRTSSDPNLNKHCQDGQGIKDSVEATVPVPEDDTGPTPDQENSSTEEIVEKGQQSADPKGSEERNENCNRAEDSYQSLQPPGNPKTSQELSRVTHSDLTQSHNVAKEVLKAGPLICDESRQYRTNEQGAANVYLHKNLYTDRHSPSNCVCPCEYSVLEVKYGLGQSDYYCKNCAIVNRQHASSENTRVRKGQCEHLRTCKRHVSQSQLSDFSLLASNWESCFPGMVVSVPNSELGQRQAFSTCFNQKLSNKHLRGVASSFMAQHFHKDSTRHLGHSNSSMCSVAVSAKNPRCFLACHCKYAGTARQLSATCCSSPSPPSHLDEDGLPIPADVVQQRLRQIEAGYKQEVELLRRQVRDLQMRLESRPCHTVPTEPEVDYEDDFTCLKESDASEDEESVSGHSEEWLSEASWEPINRKDTEVTRWVPDHMASHCFNCDSEFWLAKRRHHCRNCGNVFCASCCHLKVPIPDQQLYDPVLVCNSCYDNIQVSCARELMSQQLKKPIATASS